MHEVDLASLPDGVLILDERGIILFANHRAEHIFGSCKDGESLVGRDVDSLVPDRYRASHAQHIRNFSASGEHARERENMRFPALRRDGIEFPAEISISTIRGKDAPMVVLVVRDATEYARTAGTLQVQGAALEAAANGILIANRKGVVTWVNPAFTRLTGYEAWEVVGHTPRLLNSGKHDEKFFQEMWDTILSGHVWRGETTNRRKDGTLYCEEQTITPVCDSKGIPEHFVAIKQDVTARKQAEATLQRRLSELALLDSVATAGVEATTPDEFMEWVVELVGSANYQECFEVGWVEPSSRGFTLWRNFAERKERTVLATSYATARGDLERIARGEPGPSVNFGVASPSISVRSEHSVALRAGGRIVGALVARSQEVDAFGDDDERFMAILAGHVATAAEKLRLFLEVERMAVTDVLTGLYNRRHLFTVGTREVERALRHDRELSILMMDVDQFKQVNDRFGHAVGDEVLQVVAQQCVSNVRVSDVCCRIGGDEFVLVLPDSNEAGARATAERIRAGVGESAVESSGVAVTATISVGVASVVAGDTLSTLLARADASLYGAKRRGRDRVA